MVTPWSHHKQITTQKSHTMVTPRRQKTRPRQNKEPPLATRHLKRANGVFFSLVVTLFSHLSLEFQFNLLRRLAGVNAVKELISSLES